jgi:phospholipase/carboxylesterase
MNSAENQIIIAGLLHGQATKALVMIHGRGGAARDIITLAPGLKLNSEFTIVAPQAQGFSWYPYSFMASEEVNQPALDNSLTQIGKVVENLNAAGVRNTGIYFLGFSQGACLTLEYVTRNASLYGGVVAFTGGLIGENLNISRYTGNFSGTKILITVKQNNRKRKHIVCHGSGCNRGNYSRKTPWNLGDGNRPG